MLCNRFMHTWENRGFPHRQLGASNFASQERERRQSLLSFWRALPPPPHRTKPAKVGMKMFRFNFLIFREMVRNVEGWGTVSRNVIRVGILTFYWSFWRERLESGCGKMIPLRYFVSECFLL